MSDTIGNNTIDYGMMNSADGGKKKSHKKRTIIIIIAAIVVLVVAAFAAKHFLGSKGGATVDVVDNANADTIVHAVTGVDQVFVDGTVTPTQSEEFTKDETLGKLGELQVTDGQVVDAGTVLYQYDNTALDTEINSIQQALTEQIASRDKAIKQRDLELNKLNTKPLETNPETGEVIPGQDRNLMRQEIMLNYDVDAMNNAINSLTAQMNEMKAKKITTVTAPFKGTVFIPQEKTRDSAIMKLTSDESYVIGSVNERDIDKLAVDQKCTISVVSSGINVTGAITYVAKEPDAATPSEGGMPDSGGMAKFLVKISLDNKDGIRNGFHVQAAINLSNDIITIPAESVINEDGKTYVFIDDFGMLLKKEISLDTESDAAKALEADTVAVKSGLEAEDLVIVSSKQELKDGDPTPPTKMDDDSASAITADGKDGSVDPSSDVVVNEKEA
ncbi:MAG: biotin/lipoyl-binding protein [Clostridiales Family XIII bacterium]|jgi:HlyD family secretion protein|nr:biotin/lipoyl-binding protein [Clostridiales Family XIII bacterium]